MFRSTPATVLTCLCVLGLWDCAPKVGDSCQKGQAACVDDKTQLACQQGTFIVTPCKGPKGCTKNGSVVECDISANAAGDPCSSETEGNSTCTGDGKNVIECRGGKYVIEPCRGPEGCKSGANATCDTSIAEVGESCSDQVGANLACSVDGKNKLRCTDGKYVVANPCNGPAGCRVDQQNATCDRTRATAGETCQGLAAGVNACSVDGKQLLVCKDDEFVVHATCSGPKGCDASGKNLVCDTGK